MRRKQWRGRRYLVAAVLALMVGATFWVVAGAARNSGATRASSSGPVRSLATVPTCDTSLYPNSTTPLTNVAFNESEVLRAFQLSADNARVELFYNDEHALALGVSAVTVNGTTTSYASNTSAYPGTPPSGGLSPVKTGAPYYTPGQLNPPDDPATVTPLNLAIHEGTKPGTAGQPGSSDASGRPLFPALFVTDITSNPNATSGDWQRGGTPFIPNTIFGSWKYFTETITNTSVALTGAADPAKNNWSLGTGSDTPTVGFAALKNEGYGAEASWNVSSLNAGGNPITPGHTYRLYFMDHDGDQNKTGGDSGQACLNVEIPKVTPSVTTSATSSVTIGTGGSADISDVATMHAASGGAPAPTGSVTFNLYADDGTGHGCTGSSLIAGGDTEPISGSTATSAAKSISTAGTYHWTVSYSGDTSNNSLAESTCPAETAAPITEDSVVNPRSPTLSTSALTPVVLTVASTANLHDTATLKGGTTNAGGQLHFHLFKDDGSGGCGTEQGTGVVANVSGAGTAADPDTVGVDYQSPDIQVTSAGTYHWRVSYDGDTNNNAIPATACGASGEDAIVNKRSPDLATQLKSGGSNVDHVAVGDSVNDTATLTGATSDAGGTVTYTVFDNSTCTSNANDRDAGTKTVTNGIVPPSNSLQMSSAGTFYWQAHYSGDGSNNSADSPCNSEQLAVVGLSINKAADSTAVHAGDDIGFTITVTGSGPATGVVLTDDLPAGPAGSNVNWGPATQSATGDATPTCDITTVASHSVTSNGHTYTSTQHLECTSVASLGSGPNSATAQSFSVHVTSHTSSSVGFTMFNFATATSTNHGTVTDNDNTAGDTDNTLVVSALDVNKVADNATVAAGSPIGFVITVTGSGPAKAVVLTDDLPVGPSGSGVTWSIPAGGISQPAGGTLTLPTCTITTVASHSVTSFGHTYNSTQHLACTSVASMGSGADGSTPQSFSVHVTSPTLSTSGSFNLFNFACASSSNATTACDSDQTQGDNDNKITVIGQCVLGYPFTSNNPRTSQAFNESGVLRTFRGSASNVQMFYNDEHAMTLGQSPGVTPFVAEYPKPNTTTKLAADAGPTQPENPPALSIGNAAGVDPAGRPIFPALFVTDITADPSATPQSHANIASWNDWQFNGTANAPTDVYGTWKPFTPGVTVADPAKNNWWLGPNADAVPLINGALPKDEGYGAEVKWLSSALGLQSGHAYRLQFMVHDGDQNKTGGDVGQACFNAVIP